jgi:hypothetical protein
MRGQQWRDFQLDGLQRRIGVGRCQIGKHRFHPAQQATAFFQRHQRIFKAGRRGRDGGNFLAMLLQGALIGGAEMFGANAVQGRRAEGRSPVFEEGVLHQLNIMPFSGFPRQ